MSAQPLLRAADAATLETPLLLVLVAGVESFPEHLARLDLATGGALKGAWQSGDFLAKRDETALFYCQSLTGPRRVLLVGMGDAAKVDAGAVRRAAMVAGKRARKIAPLAVHCAVPEAPLDPVRVGQALAEGLAFGAWHFPRYKFDQKTPKPQFESIQIIAAGTSPELERGVEIGAAVAAGQQLARELQITPSDVCSPAYLADRAAQVASDHGIGCRIHGPDQILAEGMHALLAVARGSTFEPRFIELEYRGAGDSAPVVLVGKGVTFDSGGISIKPAQGMEEMKYDMSGSAAVIGTFEMLGRLKPAINVVGLIPSAENMISGNAYRPGDVVGSHFGKTIEVLNTDAEGRLLLADALSYARKFKPAAVVDCATLTGAVVIGLGHTATAVMGTDPELIESLRLAGEVADERLWELPLWDDYRELIKSDIADVKNTGGRPAGSITAGWFLREFVEGYPWAHLDIAGTAYRDRELATQVRGPTGILVRLFSEFLLARS